MVGKYQLQLGSDQMSSGMASSPYASDGALDPTQTSLLNPWLTPGVMNSLAAGTDISTHIADNLLASCEDSSASSPENRYFVGDGANFYMYNGTSFTIETTGSNTYVAGKTDMVSFAGKFYATSTTDITQWNGTTGLAENFGTVTMGLTIDGNAFHPLLLYQGLMWYGNGNVLATLASDGSTVVTAALTLSSKEKIVALGIDPGTGLMMISVQSVYDISDTIPSLKIIYLYDGISAKPTRKILVDDLVCAFYNVEGTVYIGCGSYLGLWNGNGVSFLRKWLNFGVGNNTDLPFKNHFTNIRNILHVVDGHQVLSYGAVTATRPGWPEARGFFYTAQPLSGTNHLSIIAPAGSNRLIINYATNKAVIFDFSSALAGLGLMRFSYTFFPRPVFIHRIRIVTTGLTGPINNGGVEFYDEKLQPRISAVDTFVVPSGSTFYDFDFDYGGTKVMGIAPQIGWGMVTSIVRIYVYYDVAE